MSAILRTSGRFFFGHLANILSGKATEAVVRHGHDAAQDLRRGQGSHARRVARRAQAIAIGRPDRARRRRPRPADPHRRGPARAARRGPLRLARGCGEPKARRRRVAEAVAPGDADAELLAALKALRGAIATAQKQPAYVIFPDRTLIEIAKKRPRSLDELAGVHGVGAVKLQKYGPAFLAVIRDRRCLNCPRSRPSGAASSA